MTRIKAPARRTAWVRRAGKAHRSRRRPWRALLGVASIMFGILPAGVRAQTLRGRVLDQRDERPLAQSIVRLLDRDGDSRAVAISDSVGRYVLRAPEPGEYYVSAEMFGYESTRSPLLALQQRQAVFAVDVSLTASPLGLPGFTVTAERFEAIKQRLRLLVGLSPSALRVAPIMRPEIDDHLAKGHNLEDLVRWQSIPSLQIVQASEGPCFLIRAGARYRIPDSCVGIYLNGVPVDLTFVPAFPLDLVETIVIVQPSESIVYPTGAVLLYTKAWIG